MFKDVELLHEADLYAHIPIQEFGNKRIVVGEIIQDYMRENARAKTEGLEKARAELKKEREGEIEIER